jgi:hypothetical protein
LSENFSAETKIDKIDTWSGGLRASFAKIADVDVASAGLNLGTVWPRVHKEASGPFLRLLGSSSGFRFSEKKSKK